jgi:hypothetical protein
MARSGLKKVVKTVKGKKGTVRRTYWVKAQGPAGKVKSAVGGFARRHSTALKVVGGLALLAGAAYGAHRAHGAVSNAGGYRAVAGSARDAARDKGHGLMNRMGFTTPGHKGHSVVGASGPVGAGGLQGSGFNAPSASGPASGHRRFGGSVGGNAAGPDKGWARLGGTVGEHYGNKRAWNRSVEPLRALVPHTTMGGSPGQAHHTAPAATAAAPRPVQTAAASQSRINAPSGSRTRASRSKINSPRLASRR